MSVLKDYPVKNWFISAVFTVAVFFLFQPHALQVGVMAHFMRIGLYVTLIACLAFYIWRVRINLAGGLAMGFFAAMMISCVVNGGDAAFILYTVENYGDLCASFLLAVAALPRFRKELLRSVVFVAGIYTVFNLIVLLFVPIGDGALRPQVAYTFLGYRTGFCRFYFPAIAASLLLDQDGKKFCSVRTLILYFSAVAQSLIEYSATSILALVLFAVGVCLISAAKPRRVLNACTFAGLYALAFLSVIVLRMQDVLSGFILALGKDVSFTGRTSIWDLIFSMIDRNHFLLGYNGVDGLVFPAGWRVGVAHNAVLDILLWGGLLGLSLAIAMVVVASVNLYRQRASKTAAILSVYLGVFFLMGLVEHLSTVAFFLFLGIACAWGSGAHTGKIMDPCGTSVVLRRPQHKR